jgi:hypothetical protein
VLSNRRESVVCLSVLRRYLTRKHPNIRASRIIQVSACVDISALTVPVVRDVIMPDTDEMVLWILLYTVA